MKKSIIAILILTFLFTSCNKNKKSNNQNNSKTKTTLKTYKLDKSTPLLLLPKETEAIINIKSIKSVFNNFEIKNNSIFGINADDEIITDFKKLMSINPLSLKDLESIGLDTSKELGLAFSKILLGKYDLSSINIIAYIPLKDSKKLLKHIESKFINGKHINFNKINISKENAYIKIFGTRADENLYLLVRNNYLFIVINPLNPQFALDTIKTLKEGKSSIKEAKLFNKTIKLTKINSGIYLYANIEDFVDSNEIRIAQEFKYQAKLGNNLINALKSYKSLALSIDFDSNDFIMNVFAILNKDSKAISILKNIKYNNSTILGLDNPALMLMSFGINVKEYVNFIKSFMEDRDNEQMDKEISKINKEFNIDLQKDLIDNFDGNFAYATYDGMSISTTNYNSVMTIGFKNAKLLETTIDKLLANEKFKKLKNHVNKTSIKGKTVYIINAMIVQIYAGFKNNELVVASSKNIYDKIMNSSKDKGFYKYAKKDKNLTMLINSDSIFYISFLEVIKALNNFKAMLPPKATTIATDILELLNYFSISMNINDTVISLNYRLKTNTKKMFFPYVADLVKKYAK